MTDSPFDTASGATLHFTTPQLEDVFDSVLHEIQSLRPLSCVIGFPKSGKTAFLERLKTAIDIETLSLVASTEQTLFHILMLHTTPEGESKPVLSKLLREKKRLVLFIDNAHLLTDGDFAFLGSLFGLAKQHQSGLQVVLVGNGEIVHRLARPENRAIYAMLGAVWTLPKLTREQSREYIGFLLENAGLAADLISNPEPLIKKAAGVIGILRMLTVTLALRALSTKEACNAEEVLECASETASTMQAAPSAAPAPTQHMGARMPRWGGLVLVLSMCGIIGLLVFFLSWLMPDLRIMDMVFRSGDAPREATSTPPVPQLEARPAGPVMQSVAKTVFRKRTKDGPYSVQLGSFATMEALLLHLPRFKDLDQNLFWNRESGTPASFSLFVGRFESFEQARDYGREHDLKDTQVVFRPFVGTIGPLTNPEQIRQVSLLLGLQEPLKVFEQELVSGVEIQFALERSREDALNQCMEAEKKGMSCAVTQYE
ncbi:AAA family ATPase [Desulfomicrobium escambiense]|uniref:AAA family ATPase n=1 Tax=Desulfomicrobium escambiense TaxID=29503 RepID=UPI00041F174B|nr:AAA family ATPase [Desulfomicrobium escambiense]